MTGLRALLVAVWFVTGSGMWMAQSSTHVQANVYTETVFGGVVLSDPARNNESNRTRLDLNGNEIDDAVGDYRVDYGGDMYERHAPETALIHLAPPKT